MNYWEYKVIRAESVLILEMLNGTKGMGVEKYSMITDSEVFDNVSWKNYFYALKYKEPDKNYTLNISYYLRNDKMGNLEINTVLTSEYMRQYVEGAKYIKIFLSIPFRTYHLER